MISTFTRLSLVTVLAVLALPAAASEQDIRNQVALVALAFADNCKTCHPDYALYRTIQTISVAVFIRI